MSLVRAYVDRLPEYHGPQTDRLVTAGGSRVVEVGTGGGVTGVELPTGTTRRLRVVVEDGKAKLKAVPK